MDADDDLDLWASDREIDRDADTLSPDRYMGSSTRQARTTLRSQFPGPAVAPPVSPYYTSGEYSSLRGQPGPFHETGPHTKRQTHASKSSSSRPQQVHSQVAEHSATISATTELNSNRHEPSSTVPAYDLGIIPPHPGYQATTAAEHVARSPPSATSRQAGRASTSSRHTSPTSSPSLATYLPASRSPSPHKRVAETSHSATAVAKLTRMLEVWDVFGALEDSIQGAVQSGIKGLSRKHRWGGTVDEQALKYGGAPSIAVAEPSNLFNPVSGKSKWEEGLRGGSPIRLGLITPDGSPKPEWKIPDKSPDREKRRDSSPDPMYSLLTDPSFWGSPGRARTPGFREGSPRKERDTTPRKRRERDQFASREATGRDVFVKLSMEQSRLRHNALISIDIAEKRFQRELDLRVFGMLDELEKGRSAANKFKQSVSSAIAELEDLLDQVTKEEVQMEVAFTESCENLKGEYSRTLESVREDAQRQARAEALALVQQMVASNPQMAAAVESK
eukprot:gene10099-7996_t